MGRMRVRENQNNYSDNVSKDNSGEDNFDKETNIPNDYPIPVKNPEPDPIEIPVREPYQSPIPGAPNNIPCKDPRKKLKIVF